MLCCVDPKPYQVSGSRSHAICISGKILFLLVATMGAAGNTDDIKDATGLMYAFTPFLLIRSRERAGPMKIAPLFSHTYNLFFKK